MSKTRQEKRSKIKPFIKVINYNHLMPTRYTLELEGLKGAISNDTFKEVTQREDAKKNVKKVLEERYTSGKNRWFFTPLSTFSISPPSGHSHCALLSDKRNPWSGPWRSPSFVRHPLTIILQSSKLVSSSRVLMSFGSGVKGLGCKSCIKTSALGSP